MAAGIILAGGQSKRMGRDKALLPVPGSRETTFVAYLAMLLAQYCDEVILVARDAAQFTHYTLPDIHIVTDCMPGVGPLMGIYTGLRASRSSHSLITAVDMPFVQPEMVSFLLSQAQDDTLLVPVVEDIPQVLLSVYPRAHLSMIQERLQAGRRDPRALLDVVPTRYVTEAQLRKIDPQLRSFINLNTPEELSSYSQ
jgi:molybdopterin-guanine dinucleotide biosynthesis protein A